MRNDSSAVLVVGAGVGGLTAAVALRARGFDVAILEADPAPRATGSGLGVLGPPRTILARLGIEIDGVMVGHRLDTVELRNQRGQLIRSLPLQTFTMDGAPRSIQRNHLIAGLRGAAGDCPIHLGAEVADYRVDGRRVTVTCTDGRTFEADVLIGADGFRSAIRRQLVGNNPVNEYGYVRWLAAIPFAGTNLQPRSVRHYWGAGQRFGIVDLGGDHAYWWGTKNLPVEEARAWSGGTADVLAAFADWPAEVRRAIELTPDAAIGGVPAQDRPFLEAWGDGPVTLLGDAAHPMLASSSQAAGSAIEDAFVLADALSSTTDPIAGLRRYEDLRREKARSLVLRSRRLNRIEQIDNPVARTARDLVVRFAPPAALRYAAVSEFYPSRGDTRARSY